MRISNKQLSEMYHKDRDKYRRTYSSGPMACKSYDLATSNIRGFKENICQIYIEDGNLHRIRKGFSECTLRNLEGKLEKITGKETIPFQKKTAKKNPILIRQPFVKTSRTMTYYGKYY